MTISLLRVSPRRAVVVDVPCVDLRDVPLDELRLLAEAALQEHLRFTVMIGDDQAKEWRSFASTVARRLDVDLVTETRRLHRGGRAAAMTIDPAPPARQPAFPGASSRSGEALSYGLIAAIEGALEAVVAEQKRVARTAAIAATPDVPACVEEGDDVQHTHACQHRCCPAACDLVTSGIERYLAEHAAANDDVEHFEVGSEVGDAFDDWIFDDDAAAPFEVDTAEPWISEALGRTHSWDRREHLLILRDLLHDLPCPGRAKTSFTGDYGMLESLCETHQERYPDVLVWTDEAADQRRYDHDDDQDDEQEVGQGYALRADVEQELRRRIAAELEIGF